MACSAVQYFSTLAHKRQDKKNVIDHAVFVSIFSTILYTVIYSVCKQLYISVVIYIYIYICTRITLWQHVSTVRRSSSGLMMVVPRSKHVAIVWSEWVKCFRYRPGVAQRVGRGIALLFHDRCTRRGSGQQHAPAALYSRERPGTLCTGGWVGPRAGLDGWKISSLPGLCPGLSSL